MSCHLPHRIARTTLALAICGAFGALAAPVLAADNSLETRLQALEARLAQIETENQALKQQLKQTDQKVEVTGEQMEKIASQGITTKANWADSTQFGGYGELHLNQLRNNNPGGNDKKEMDFHRFVLYMGHQFNDRLRFFSELEVEHNTVEGGKGAVELEQAYLDFMLTDNVSVKAGSFLLPVGILNETHEPNTFYGVERNPIETRIIPTTWWEGGVGATARLGNSFTLDGAITTGMKADAADKYAVRAARQQLAEGNRAKDPAYTARLKWAGLPGVELTGSVQYQSDMAQSTDAAAGAARLYETHAVINKGPFGLKALYARWSLDGNGPKTLGADKQYGWYIEPSFKINDAWGLFARYNRWDNQAGGGDGVDSSYRQVDVGINYWPHPDVVVKLDLQSQKAPVGKDEFDGFNVGIGYRF
jgi:hypothetical protein